MLALLLVAVLAGAVTIALRAVSAFAWLEHGTVQARFSVRGERPVSSRRSSLSRSTPQSIRRVGQLPCRASTTPWSSTASASPGPASSCSTSRSRRRRPTRRPTSRFARGARPDRRRGGRREHAATRWPHRAARRPPAVRRGACPPRQQLPAQRPWHHHTLPHQRGTGCRRSRSSPPRSTTRARASRTRPMARSSTSPAARARCPGCRSSTCSTAGSQRVRCATRSSSSAPPRPRRRTSRRQRWAGRRCRDRRSWPTPSRPRWTSSRCARRRPTMSGLLALGLALAVAVALCLRLRAGRAAGRSVAAAGARRRRWPGSSERSSRSTPARSSTSAPARSPYSRHAYGASVLAGIADRRERREVDELRKLFADYFARRRPQDPRPGSGRAGRARAQRKTSSRVTGSTTSSGRAGWASSTERPSSRSTVPVALKLIRPQHALSPLFRARFEHESQAAAKVSHPSIVPVYAAGQDDGLLYIAMMLVDGVDLARTIELSVPSSPSAGPAAAPDRLRARRGAQPGTRPSRRQAGEHPRDVRSAACVPHGLRHRKASRRRARA